MTKQEALAYTERRIADARRLREKSCSVFSEDWTEGWAQERAWIRAQKLIARIKVS